MRAKVPSPDAVSATLMLERALAGEPAVEPHLAQIAPVAGDRLRRDRDDAEAVAARERGEHAAFVDAEHRPPRRLAAHVQAGIAEAGDDEGVGRVVLLDQPRAAAA